MPKEHRVTVVYERVLIAASFQAAEDVEIVVLTVSDDLLGFE